MVRPRLKGEAYLVRYIDDFVVCFQYRDDALRFQNVLRKRLGKFGLVPEPTKTKLVEFGPLCPARCRPAREKTSRDDLFSGHDPVLYA